MVDENKLESELIHSKNIYSFKELEAAKPYDIVFIDGRTEVVVGPEEYKIEASFQNLGFDKEDIIYTVSLWPGTVRENRYIKKFYAKEEGLPPTPSSITFPLNWDLPVVNSIKKILREKGLMK